MSPRSRVWVLGCLLLLAPTSGCQFFGIDTRPEIQYVTEKERKNVAEPMYSMKVAGTSLYKQWPMRLGPDYGYAPWQKKPENPNAAPPILANMPAASDATPNTPAPATSPALHAGRPRADRHVVPAVATENTTENAVENASGDESQVDAADANTLSAPPTPKFRPSPTHSTSTPTTKPTSKLSAPRTPLPWRATPSKGLADDVAAGDEPMAVGSDIALQQPSSIARRPAKATMATRSRIETPGEEDVAAHEEVAAHDGDANDENKIAATDSALPTDMSAAVNASPRSDIRSRPRSAYTASAYPTSPRSSSQHASRIVPSDLIPPRDDIPPADAMLDADASQTVASDDTINLPARRDVVRSVAIDDMQPARREAVRARPISEGDDEPVVVTASDMGEGDGIPTNSPDAGSMTDALEAAKRAVLPN